MQSMGVSQHDDLTWLQPLREGPFVASDWSITMPRRSTRVTPN